MGFQQGNEIRCKEHCGTDFIYCDNIGVFDPGLVRSDHPKDVAALIFL